mgnify:CR=1 FL=1
MANIYGVNHTAQYVTIPSQKFSVGDFGGRVRAKYDGTRHNLGWMALVDWLRQNGGEGSFRRQDKFSSQLYTKGEVGLLFPETYMNRSGGAVAEAVNDICTESRIGHRPNRIVSAAKGSTNR